MLVYLIFWNAVSQRVNQILKINNWFLYSNYYVFVKKRLTCAKNKLPSSLFHHDLLYIINNSKGFRRHIIPQDKKKHSLQRFLDLFTDRQLDYRIVLYMKRQRRPRKLTKKKEQKKFYIINIKIFLHHITSYRNGVHRLVNPRTTKLDKIADTRIFHILFYSFL